MSGHQLLLLQLVDKIPTLYIFRGKKTKLHKDSIQSATKVIFSRRANGGLVYDLQRS